jgi:hypothetical protein
VTSVIKKILQHLNLSADPPALAPALALLKLDEATAYESCTSASGEMAPFGGYDNLNLQPFT